MPLQEGLKYGLGNPFLEAIASVIDNIENLRTAKYTHSYTQLHPDYSRYASCFLYTTECSLRTLTTRPDYLIG
jgi:hypothetical protein